MIKITFFYFFLMIDNFLEHAYVPAAIVHVNAQQTRGW